jgi:glycosyltransferase involved in cell wall biosynthesis
MTIHHIVNSDSIHAGGAEKLVRRLCYGLSTHGLKTRLVGLVPELESKSEGSIQGRIDKTNRFQPEAMSNGEVNPVCLNVGSLNSFKAFGKVVGYIKNCVREGEIVHAHLSPTVFYCAAAKWLLRKRFILVITEHNSHNNRRGKWYGKLLDTFLYRSVDHTACISEGAHKALLNWMPFVKNRASIIDNGVTLHFTRFVERSEAISTVKILSVGRLHEQKNIASALSAIAIIRKQKPEIKMQYIIAGSGAQDAPLRALTNKLGLENTVNFLGNRTDVPDLLAEADIFLMPSLWEGFGLAAVEAMNAGLPIVASNVDGLSEVINSQGVTAGILIDPEDTLTIGHALIKLIEQPKLRSALGRIGFERAQHFSESRMCQGYSELYKSIRSEPN